MFKFPLRRNRRNQHQLEQHHQFATECSDDGFIYIRCDHQYKHNKSIDSQILSNTVQTTWRPQVPIAKQTELSNESLQSDSSDERHQTPQTLQPRHSTNNKNLECEMSNLNHSNPNDSLKSSANAESKGALNNLKKWSIGRFFYRSKVKTNRADTSSEDDDRNAGFSPSQKQIPTHTIDREWQKKSNNPLRKHFDLFQSNETIIGSKNENKIVNNSVVLNDREQYNNQYQQHYSNYSNYPNYNYPSGQSTTDFNDIQRVYCNNNQIKQLDKTIATAAATNTTSFSSGSQLIIGTTSSDEDIQSSKNKLIQTKYRSDESITNGSVNGLMTFGPNRKSRSARNERYYKRLSRDSEISHGQIPIISNGVQSPVVPPAPSIPVQQHLIHRWKTQPILLPSGSSNGHRSVIRPQPIMYNNYNNNNNNIYNNINKYNNNNNNNTLRNTVSLQQMSSIPTTTPQTRPLSRNMANVSNSSKRSISYDNYIHLQNINGKFEMKPLLNVNATPIPRESLRQINKRPISSLLKKSNGSFSDLRPNSYAFDQIGVPIINDGGGTLNDRCVSDDRIWTQSISTKYCQGSQNNPNNQSIQSLDVTSSNHTLLKSERNIINKNANNLRNIQRNDGGFHYIADATPRSRKPIHFIEQNINKNSLQNSLSTSNSQSILRTTKNGLPANWSQYNDGSRIYNLSKNQQMPHNYYDYNQNDRQNKSILRMGLYSTSAMGLDEVDKAPEYSVPIKKQLSSRNITINSTLSNQDSKISINNNTINNKQLFNNNNNNNNNSNSNSNRINKEKFNTNINPIKKPIKSNNIIYIKKKKPQQRPTNLEDAIKELESIYNSLGLHDKVDQIPNTNKTNRSMSIKDFEEFALTRANEYDDDEDSPTGEPDPIRDDVAYRNIKLANLPYKKVERQLPFGIPMTPIPPTYKYDYLQKLSKENLQLLLPSTSESGLELQINKNDDMAIRNSLRNNSAIIDHKKMFEYCSISQPLNKGYHTDNMNKIIQKDAIKPSGGSNLLADNNINLSSTNLTNQRDDYLIAFNAFSNDDQIPNTLKVLQKIKADDYKQGLEQALKLKSPIIKKNLQIPFRHPSQGGAISQLPTKLLANRQVKVNDNNKSAPMPMPRKSLTPDPSFNQHHSNGMEEILNRIALDAQQSSIKLSQELQELRNEAFISSAIKPVNSESPIQIQTQTQSQSQVENIEQDLWEIEKVSEAAKQCSEMLLKSLPKNATNNNLIGNRKCSQQNIEEEQIQTNRVETQLNKAIDKVSEAANKVCNKILGDSKVPLITMEKDCIKLELETKLTHNLDSLCTAKEIDVLAKRCLNQINNLTIVADEENILNKENNDLTIKGATEIKKEDNLIPTSVIESSLMKEKLNTITEMTTSSVIEEIDRILKECNADIGLKESPEITANRSEWNDQNNYCAKNELKHPDTTTYLFPTKMIDDNESMKCVSSDINVPSKSFSISSNNTTINEKCQTKNYNELNAQLMNYATFKSQSRQKSESTNNSCVTPTLITVVNVISSGTETSPMSPILPLLTTIVTTTTTTTTTTITPTTPIKCTFSPTHALKESSLDQSSRSSISNSSILSVSSSQLPLTVATFQTDPTLNEYSSSEELALIFGVGTYDNYDNNNPIIDEWHWKYKMNQPSTSLSSNTNLNSVDLSNLSVKAHSIERCLLIP